MTNPTRETFGCACCFGEDPVTAWASLSQAELVADLIEESHLDVSVVVCGACGQRFVKVFTERIDWQNGDDPQDWLVVPVTDAESERILARGESVSSADLAPLGVRRQLLRTWPSAGPKDTFWIEGTPFIPPHD